MRRGQTDTYPAFPEIKAQLGYNPARFLVSTDNNIDELSWETRAKAFIRGMDVETIRAWQTVEVALEQGQNGGPRRQVMKWLNHRQAALNGTDASWEETESPDESSHDDTTAIPDGPVEPTLAEADVSTTTALAADGGTTTDATPTCPDCHGELTHEEIAGKTGYWCPQCQDFREPVAPTEVPA